MTKEEATKQIAEKMKQMKEIMKECRKIAKDNDVDFVPHVLNESEWNDVGSEKGWMPSSAYC